MNSPHIAKRIQLIKPSPSSAAADRANELRRQGESIVNLVVGEPDFDTPSHICAAACDAIAKGHTRYTNNNGTPELRQAIADKLKRENRLSYAAADIIVTNGAKSAIYTALAATLEPGDEVIIPAPFWVSYPDMVLACEGTPVHVVCSEDADFKLTANQLREAITERTRWLLINSPSNPTGASYTEDEYRQLAEVLMEHPQVMIMTDDIYEHIRYDENGNPHLLNVEPRLSERTVTINGVSKTYAMTGWRIGYAAGPASLIKAFGTLQSQSSGNACSVSQAAALAALDGDQSFVSQSRQIYQQRRDSTLEAIRKIPGLSCAQPSGAFYLYVNCRDLLGQITPQGKKLESDGDVVMYLLECAGVAVVAGTAYGLSPYFRLSIATSQEILDEGCRRIAKAVEALN